MGSRHSHSALVHLQGLRHLLLQRGELAPASSQKQGGWGPAVELYHPVRHLTHQAGGGGADGVQNLLRLTGLLQPQNIGKGDVLALPQRGFYLLRGAVIHQIPPHQGLRQLITGHGRHGVPHHAPIPADGNIGGARPDVHQSQV